MARTDLAWISWGNLIKFGLAGVSVAVFSYYILQARVEQQNPTLWQRIKAVIGRNGDPEGKPSLEDENEKTGWIEYLKDSFLSPESQEVIEDIGRLIERVNDYDLDGKQYNGSLFVLLAVIKKIQNISEFEAWEQNLPDVTNIPQTILDEVKYYSNFAFNVYSASTENDTKAIAEKMNIPEDDLILENICEAEEENYCPKFVFLIDHESRKLILAVRGTKSIGDCLLDMVCDDSPFLTGHAHSGILRGARELWTLVSASVVSALTLHPDYDLIVTGHSLGGGVAVLVAMEILMEDKAMDSRPVRCFAYAPPPVFRNLNQVPASVRSQISIVINNHDIIPRTSLGSIARLVTSLRAVDELHLSLMDQIRVIRRAAASRDCDHDEEEEEEEVSKLMEKVITAIDSSRQEEFPFLQHPGTVIYLKRQTSKYIAISDDTLTRPTRLFLLSDMISDHKRNSYENALGSVLC